MRSLIVCIVISIIFTGCASDGFLYRDGWMWSDRSGRGQSPSLKGQSPQVRGRIVETAKRYIGVDYVHGGATPRGFDCSGFVMYVYRENRIDLPRSTRDQYGSGRRITLGRARPGDLVFFQTSARSISHVGIYLGDYRFIHAPSTGKSVSITEITNPYWRKRFRGAVTFF